jgi:hypothetical protein
MPDRSDSRRPQDRDFVVDDWDKFPFKSTKDDPYENRSEERKDDSQQSQYKYEGWEHEAFPNKNVSEKPAEPAEAREKGVQPPASNPSPNKDKDS